MKRLLLTLLFFIGLQQAALAASCSSYPFTLQNNTTADATQVMADFNTVRNCVINNAAGSGVNTDITSITGLSTPLSNAQGGTAVYIGGTSGGTANAQTVATVTPIGFALTNGWRVTFLAGLTNTGAAQLNVNSTGLTDVKKLGHAGLEALSGGEITAGNVVEAIYDGTEFVLLTTPFSDIGPATSITAASSTDLGTIPSHNVLINGTTSITSFGSTAVTTEPIYIIKFSGALTLTYNATSLLIPNAGNITTAANDTATVEYLGSGNWQVLNYTRYSGAALVAVTPIPGALGLTIQNNAGTPNTHIDLAASLVTMLNTSNVPISATAVSVTINCATTGANGLDTGSLGASKWYYVWAISNGSVASGLASLSATAPTMPAGYTYKVLLGAFPTDSGSIFMRIYQAGSDSQYKIVVSSNTTLVPVISTGAVGTYSTTSPSLTAVTVTGDSFPAPSNATRVRVVASQNWKAGGGNGVLVAANTDWGGTNNGPAGSAGQAYPIHILGGGNSIAMQADFLLEGTTIAIAGGTGTFVGLMGWKNPVNAN